MNRRLIVIIVGAAVALLMVVGAVIANTSAPAQADCDSRFGTSCTEIPQEQLEAAFDLEFPEGTEIVDSKYVSFQDWNLTATLALPDGEIELGEEWSSGEPDADGEYRSFEYSTGEDGRTVLMLRLFTT